MVEYELMNQATLVGYTHEDEVEYEVEFEMRDHDFRRYKRVPGMQIYAGIQCANCDLAIFKLTKDSPDTNLTSKDMMCMVRVQ